MLLNIIVVGEWKGRGAEGGGKKGRGEGGERRGGGKGGERRGGGKRGGGGGEREGDLEEMGRKLVREEGRGKVKVLRGETRILKCDVCMCLAVCY